MSLADYAKKRGVAPAAPAAKPATPQQAGSSLRDFAAKRGVVPVAKKPLLPTANPTTAQTQTQTTEPAEPPKKTFGQKAKAFVKEVAIAIPRALATPFATTYQDITAIRTGQRPESVSVPILGEIGVSNNPKKAAGQLAGRALDIGTAAVGGGAIASTAGKAAFKAGAKEAAAEVIEGGAKVVAKRVAVDAGVGATYGAATEMQNEDATAADIARSALVGGAVGAVAPTAIGATLKGTGKIVSAASRAAGDALESNITKLEKFAAPTGSSTTTKRVFQGIDKPVQTATQKAAESLATFGRKIQALPDKFSTSILDRFHPLAKLRDKAKAAGIDVADIQDSAQGAGYRAAGKAENKLDDYLAVREANKDVWQDAKEYARYLDALDRKKLGQEIEGGHSIDDIQRSIAELEASMPPERFARVREANDRMQQFLRNELDEAKASGRISQESYDSMRAAYKNYIPHNVLDYLEDGASTEARGKSLNMAKNGFKKAVGSKRQIDDIDNAIVDRIYRNSVNNEKNKVMNEIIDAGTQFNDGTFVKYSDSMKPVDYEKAGLAKVSRFVDGKKEDWLVPKDIEVAIKGLDDQEAGAFANFMVKALQPIADIKRKLATSSNPVFAVFSNPVRDIQTQQITAKIGPRDYAKSFSNMILGKVDDEIVEVAGKPTNLIRLARESGAIQGGIFREGVKPEEILHRKVRQEGGSLFGVVAKLNKLNPFSSDNIAQQAGEQVEQMTRLAAFRSALRQGMTPQQAAKVARDATVDFGKAGAAIRTANKVVPFLNARIQGFANLLRAAKDNPTRAVRGLMMTAAYPTAVLTGYNTKYESYFDIPDNEKRKYWIIMVGESMGRDYNGREVKIPHYIKIPKGEAQQAVSAVMERTLTLAKQKNPEKTSEFISSLVEDISPVTDSSLMPAGIGEAAELTFNKSLFRDKSIVPEYLYFNNKAFESKNLEPRMQYNEYTSEVAKAVGGLLNFSPIQIDYVTRIGVMNEIYGTADMVLGKQKLGGIEENVDHPFEKAAKLPFIRSVIGTKNYRQSEREKVLKAEEEKQKTMDKLRQVMGEE